MPAPLSPKDLSSGLSSPRHGTLGAIFYLQDFCWPQQHISHLSFALPGSLLLLYLQRSPIEYILMLLMVTGML